jgi:hypothetical protein
MSSPEEEYLDWAPRWRIPLPSDEAEKYVVINIRDVRRLRKRIEQELSPRREIISTAYFALFGAALATGASVPPLLIANGLPSWISSIFIVSASSFLILGLILVLIDRTLRKSRGKATSEIAQEMRDIEESYRGRKSRPDEQPSSGSVPPSWPGDDKRDGQ